MNEPQLEELCLGWFRETGWEVCFGPDTAPDAAAPLRHKYEQVVLESHLRVAFDRINSHIPADQLDSCFEQLTATLLTAHSPDPVSNNRAFHHLLLDGVPVQYKRDDQPVSDHALLIDFDRLANNRLVAINQFSVAGPRHTRRPDIVCFINGLPLVVIELKSPSDEKVDIRHAFNQLQTYKKDIADLFIFNEALVISDGYDARLGSLTATWEWFMRWRTIADENDRPQLEWQLETLVRGFLNPELLLDYLRFFILFESDGRNSAKKIAGYHQFHAVRAAVQATITATQTDQGVGEQRATYAAEVEPGSKKAGVFWHTQGSGKSLSMCFYAGKLLQQPAMHNPTLVVVTDRVDLQGQLYTTFGHAWHLFKQKPEQAANREELRRLLAERDAGGIIFTTIQKFALLEDEQSHPVLNNRDNIVVISDEAHRSQYGLRTRLNEAGQYRSGFARSMRDALPNAAFIGFTGTPVALEDRDTRAVFGDYVSIYDIQDAVDDGATVPIYYESRLARLDLNHDEIADLSEQVEEVIEDQETEESREKIKGEWSRLEKLVGTTPRLKQVAADLIGHFQSRNQSIEGKALIVAMSRDICVRLYDQIVALRPQWHSADPAQGEIKIVMTGSAADKKELQPHIYNKPTREQLARRFKNPEDSLRLVIVCDMWLTGFDVPCCHTMYLDKPMKGLSLMQAIARVNRVFQDKPGGLVVDYIGIASELKHALKTYIDSKGRGKPTIDSDQAVAVLEEKMETIRALFARTTEHQELDISAFETDAPKLLVAAANHILGIKDGKKRFLDLVLAASKAWSLCSTVDRVSGLRTELAFYSALKAAISKHTSVDARRSQEEKNSILRRILDNAVIAGEVTDLFDLCGLEKPNIGLLSDEFLNEVRQMPYKNLAVELLEKLLNDRIGTKSRNNVVQQQKYADRLRETLRKYHNRAIETAQVIEELIEMAKDFQKEAEKHDQLGLNRDEIAFYDALANNESAVRELGDETLKKIAVEITEKLKQSTSVDWQLRENVRAQLRVLVRRTLKRWKYPPDQQLQAVDLVLKQAEAFSAEISG